MTAAIPYSFSHVIGSLFCKEHSSDLKKLPKVLAGLDSLLVNTNYHFEHSTIICKDIDFVEYLVKNYQYLWAMLALMEQHPAVDWSLLLSACKNLNIHGDMIDSFDGVTVVKFNMFHTFQVFMYEGVSAYREAYKHFLLTGEVKVVDLPWIIDADENTESSEAALLIKSPAVAPDAETPEACRMRITRCHCNLVQLNCSLETIGCLARCNDAEALPIDLGIIMGQYSGLIEGVLGEMEYAIGGMREIVNPSEPLVDGLCGGECDRFSS